MEYKVKRHPKNTIYSILMAVLLSIFCSSSPVRGEAVTAVLGEQAANYTCGEIKKMAQKTPEYLFKMWANSGTIDTHSATAIQIIRAGNVQWMLENIGDVTTSIQIIEEAVYGTPENALKILSKALLSKSFSAAMKIAGAGGAPGAALFVCETLYSFNGYLSAESLDSNLKAFANLSKKNPEMLDINYFQKTYLGWDGKSWNDQINKKYGWREMTARRDSVVEYANRKLLNPDFPQISEWDENVNVVRTTIHIIIKDVRDILEKERKFKQLQEELKTKLAALKKEHTVLTSFQSLRNQLLSMTCQDSSQPCLDAYNSAMGMMKTLILDAGDITVPESLKNSVNGLYTSLESMDSFMQSDYKSKIQGYCNAVNAGSLPLIEGIAQAKSINSEIAARAVQSKTYMDTACAATSLSIAKEAAEMAKSTADQAILLFNKLPLVPTFEKPDSPPAPIDFSGREGELSSLEEKVEKYKNASGGKRHAFENQASIARNGLKHMIAKCNNSPVKGMSAQARASLMEENIKDIESRLPDIGYQKLFIEGLSSKIEAIRWYITSLKGQNQSYRDCLDNLPDIQAMVVEFNSLLETGKTDVDRAKQGAATAADCYDSLKQNSPCNTDADCEPGYVCHNGKCVEPEAITCKPNENCPEGYVCSDTGVCILSDAGSLFGTTGGEDSQTGQGDLFGTTGGETTAGETTSSVPDVNCDHIPGSTAVQGNCICTDGLILSPSQGRCISCGEYYQAAKNAITDGALNAAQSIVNEAGDCTSWTAQVQGLINSARQDQACRTIAANLQAACQSNNAKAAHGFMGEANQNNCNIDAGLWQWGNTLITQYNQKIDEQRAAQQQQQQQQAQAQRPQQPQNQTNWMDVMSEIVKGVQGVQQGHSRPPKRTSTSSSGSKPLPTSGTVWQTRPMPTAGTTYPGSKTWSSGSGNTSASNGQCGRKMSKAELAPTLAWFQNLQRKQWQPRRAVTWNTLGDATRGLVSDVSRDRYSGNVKIWRKKVNCYDSCVQILPVYDPHGSKGKTHFETWKSFHRCIDECYGKFKYMKCP